MSDVVIEVELPSQQYERLAAIARNKQVSVAEAAQVALAEWLERQTQVECARRMMRELGEGLGEGPAPHDAARRHDGYLYGCNRT